MSRVNKVAYKMCRQLMRNKHRRWLLIVLLCIFLLVCFGHSLVHCSHCVSSLSQGRFTITAEQQALLSLFYERSLSSWLLYLISFLVALTMLIIALFYEKKFNYFFCILYFAIFLDDFLEYHETFGTWLSQNFNLPIFFNLREQDVGETLAWLICGIILVPFIKLFRGLSARDFVFSFLMIYLFALLLFFGWFLDMVSIAISSSAIGAILVRSLEDAGEFLSLSLVLTLVLCEYHRLSSKRKYK